MTTNKRDRKDKWEREHVQCVLDYHNEKYGIHIVIKGKATDIYDLKGQLNWDWVCYDTETGDEIAIEVKKLTASKLEEKSHVMWQILEDVRNSLSGSKKLPGTFFLSIEMPKDYYLPFNKQQNKREFKSVLSQAICRTAQRLKTGKTKDLKPQISKQLPFALLGVSVCNLHKFSDEGNALYKGFGTVGWWPIGFDKRELEKFNDLVSQANMQLKAANVRETFLVLIEEGHRPIDPHEITEAFTSISTESHSEIKYFYFIRGEEIQEISLLTP